MWSAGHHLGHPEQGQTRNRKENGWIRTPTNPPTDNDQKENGWLRTRHNKPRFGKERGWSNTPANLLPLKHGHFAFALKASPVQLTDCIHGEALGYH